MADDWAAEQMKALGLAARAFSPSQARDPHSGEWIPAGFADHLHGKQVHGKTGNGQEVQGLFDHKAGTVQPRHMRAVPVAHVKPLGETSAEPVGKNKHKISPVGVFGPAVMGRGVWDSGAHPRVAAGAAGGGEFAPAAAGQTAPTNAKPVGMGERGKRVKDLQARLNALGANLKTDGVFGPKTLAAVRSYQKDHGLKVDGLVGPKTTAALRAPRPGHKPPAQARRAFVPTPEPHGKPGGPGLYGERGAEHSALFQHLVTDLMAKGKTESEASRLAWGIIRNFAAGHDGKGNKVSATTQAEASAALAQENKTRADAKATRSSAMATDSYDTDGLDVTWDGEHGDLPDLSGVDVAGLEAAESALGMTPEPGEAARALPPLGKGGRFAKVKAALAAKGAKDPGALAAFIGRRKYGKGKFAKLAASAKAPAAVAARAGELFRTWPLEECRIMRSSEGREYGSGRVVEAYAAVYGQQAEIHDHEGHYLEDIDHGAFDDAIRSAHPDRNGGYWGVTCLYNHGMTVHGTPAERFSLPPGVPRWVSSEDRGLLTRTEYARTPLGDELLELVDMGALRTQSFTGGIMRSDPMLRGPGDRYRARGGVLQRVKRLVLGLREFGLTPFAAYTGAEVLGVRMQLPGSVSEPDSAEFEEGDGPEPAAAGVPPADGSASRSTGNRLYSLRTEEMLRQAGIELPS